jgi:hypothetical protein
MNEKTTRDWTTWNVNLWLTNDETMYRWLYRLAEKHGTTAATAIAFEQLRGTKTPDGAPYRRYAVAYCVANIL